MSHLDGAVLHGIDDLQAGNDFASGEDLYLEFVVSCLSDGLGHDLRRTVKRIEGFRPAACHAPFDLRRRLRDRRRSNGCPRHAHSSSLDEVTTFHRILSPETRAPDSGFPSQTEVPKRKNPANDRGPGLRSAT